ncbi:MAG: hypothetical protein C0483_20910 [Pirellula sp.]|nr:hypothetical protein [Pirellula sp.]
MAQNSENLRKAALFVAALDAETADSLLDRLQPTQAGLLRRVLVELDDVENDLQRAAVAEFVGCAPRALDAVAESAVADEPAPVRYGAAAYDQAGQRTPTADVPFRFLHEAPGEDLSELLEGEHPQTVAVVLSHLPPPRAAAVVASLSESLQADVLRRLARLDETDPATLNAVETELERRFRNRFPTDRGRTSGVGAVQSILSEASPAVRRTLIAGISRQDLKLATRLTRPTLTFADLPQLADTTLRTLCDEAEPEILAVALAGAELAYGERFVAVLPRVQAAQLRRAIDTLGPTRLSDVEIAQRELVETAHRLEVSGRLEWTAGSAPHQEPTSDARRPFAAAA